MRNILYILLLVFCFTTVGYAAETNTVTSTVVSTDKTPPTASSPSIVVNNTDVCKSAMSSAIQTQIFGFSSGITISDSTCELLKLSRTLYGMGMKVAGVSLLCSDKRVFDAMWMAGTPCPYKGKIGNEAKIAWVANPKDAPEGNSILIIKEKVEDYSSNTEDDYPIDPEDS